MLCAAKMLNHVNLRFYGDMLRGAIDKVLKGGKVSYSVSETTNLHSQLVSNTIYHHELELVVYPEFHLPLLFSGSHQRLGWTIYNQRIHLCDY